MVVWDFFHQQYDNEERGATRNPGLLVREPWKKTLGKHIMYKVLRYKRRIENWRTLTTLLNSRNLTELFITGHAPFPHFRCCSFWYLSFGAFSIHICIHLFLNGSPETYIKWQLPFIAPPWGFFNSTTD